MQTHNTIDSIRSLQILAELRRARDRLHAVQDIGEIGIWELRIADQYLSWSEEACRVAGIAAKGFNGSVESFLSFVHPDDQQKALAVLERAAQGKAILDTELRIAQPDGERYLHLRAQLLREEAGQLLFGTVQDISWHKMNEKKLEENEAMLRAAAKMMRIGGWKIVLPDRHLIWADEFADILDFPPGPPPSFEEAIRGYPPEAQAEIDKVFSECARNGTPYDKEWPIVTPKGRHLWIRAIGQALRDDYGTIIAVHGAFQDITEKKKAEEELRRLTTRLTTTLESLTDAFFTVDREWRFTYVNKEAERVLRRSREEILGKKIWNEFKEGINSEFYHGYHRAMCENCPVSFEAYYPPLQGWGEARVYPTEEGIAVYFTDISERKRAEEAIRESEERLEIVAKVTSDVICDWDIKTDTIWWGEGIHSVFGFPPQDLEKGLESWKKRIHPDDLDRISHRLQTALDERHEHWDEEYRFMRQDGSYAYVQERGIFMRDADGNTARLVCSIEDITERKQAELERQESEMRMREHAALLDKAQDAIIVCNIDGEITFWNKGAERIFGWTAEEAIGQSKITLLFADSAVAIQPLHAVLEEGDWRGELRKRRKDGGTLIVEAHWTLVRDDDGKPQSILAIDTDITQRKEAEREIERLAFFDPLTHLPNRRLLLNRLQHALATASRSRHTGGLLFLDLDNFKTLNDTLGHDKGDLLLQQVARRLESCVSRKSDTVARLGGDEFVVMLEDLNESLQEAAVQTEVVAEKILAVFNRPFNLGGYEHHTSPSIGVALFDSREEDNIDDLMKRADLAMYQAKASGRNTIRFFDPEMQTVVTARVALETDLRHGLRKHEFFLQYQLQADSAGRKIGAEALVRWQNPRRGLVSPALFIPLAEETGLILRLGQWVLQTACQQLAAWGNKPETAHLTLAVNVSARQFRHPDFVGQVLRILEETGANPRNLKLELTESLLVENVESTVTKMTALKAKGVSFSLDDFGTGYSSLSYLKRLPLDQLKIDQSFVRDVLTDANDAAIARTIVALGQTLGLDVIAEGVETEEQREFLAQNGCHAYQGYLFGPPLLAEQVDAQ